MKRIYIDMDGTLAVFNNQIESEEVLWEKGYFRNLSAQQNVVEAARLLTKRQDVEVFVLSAVLPTPYAAREKNEWLDEFLPEVDQAHRLFVPCGEDKGKYIGHALGKDDVLLDDYSKNLQAWCPPGRAVKLMNDINGRFGTWHGARISYHQPPKQIAENLLVSLGLMERIYRGYHIIRSKWEGRTEVVIGYDPNDVPQLDNPYMCWYSTENSMYFLGEAARTKEEALAIFNQRTTALEKLAPHKQALLPRDPEIGI